MKSITSFLPPEIVQVGTSLEEIGIKEIAWDYATVIKIFHIIQRDKCFVIGGDVYKTVSGNVESTYDSWYANKSEMTAEESLWMARKFIEDYHQRQGDGYLYTVVVG